MDNGTVTAQMKKHAALFPKGVLFHPVFMLLIAGAANKVSINLEGRFIILLERLRGREQHADKTIKLQDHIAGKMNSETESSEV